jgi:hypothetical protein
MGFSSVYEFRFQASLTRRRAILCRNPQECSTDSCEEKAGQPMESLF